MNEILLFMSVCLFWYFWTIFALNLIDKQVSYNINLLYWTLAVLNLWNILLIIIN